MNIDNDEREEITIVRELLRLEVRNDSSALAQMDAWAISDYIFSKLATQRQSLKDEVLAAIEGQEIDINATEKHIKSVAKTEDEYNQAMLSAQIDRDDRHDTLNDVRTAISTIFEDDK